MSVTQAILAILGSILLSAVGWYINKLAKQFLQRYRDRVNQGKLEDARKQAQIDNQKANIESDNLKKIDGR